MRFWSDRRSNSVHRKQAQRSLLGKLESLESRAMMAGLVQQSDLSYLGAFNVPQGQIGASTFEYGGTALAFNPANDSLFLVGHDYDQSIAEIAIPEMGTGGVGELAEAPVLQSFASVLDRIPNQTLENDNPIKLGGLMVDGDRLIGTAYEYYDGNGNAVDSHFTMSSLDVDDANVEGLYQVGNLGGGYVGGYMTKVPAQWQDELGAAYLTGQAGLSIIGRTSAGPAAFGFDPADLGESAAPATPLVNYPLENPLAPEMTQNPLFNTTSEIKGIVFPEGTDSVLFIGSHGTGEWWYGEAEEGGLYDPHRPEKGPHAPDYVYQVWAYDVHDLIAVKNGEKQPWEIQPYDVWHFDLPYADGARHIGGATYDAATGRLFVSQQSGNEGYPVIHAFQVGEPTADPTPEPPPGSDPLSNRPPTQVLLASAVTALPEMTPVSADLKLADISVADDGLGTNHLWLSGGDQARFAIAGDSLYLKAGVELDHETQAALRVTVNVSDAELGATISTEYVLQISNINDAPVLNSALNPSLGTILEDSGGMYGMIGTSISSLLDSAVTDQDAGAVKGIAVTGASNYSGTWQYTLNGGMTWLPMAQPTSQATLLLPADGVTQVRFIPLANFHGVVQLHYRAWDRTQGVPGGSLASTGNTGRDGSLSTAYESAPLTVQAVNDNPLLSLSGGVAYKLNGWRIVLAPFATVSDVDSRDFSGGTLRVNISTGSDVGNRLTIGAPFVVSQGKLMYNGLQIGTIKSNGTGLNPLEIAFTRRATPAVVELLVRSIAFHTYQSTNSTMRTVHFQLTDGDGGTSQVQTKTVLPTPTTTLRPPSTQI